jgi:hypothetical protein
MKQTENTINPELIKTIQDVLDIEHDSPNYVLAEAIAEKLFNLEDGKCPVCHAKISKYKSQMNIVQSKALIKISKGVILKAQTRTFQEANDIFVSHLPNHLELTHSERSNLSKLRLHGLIAKVKEDGQVQAGRWLVTKRGWEYLKGQAVPAYIYHFRNKVINSSEETITIGEAMKGLYSDTIANLQIDIATLPGDLK